MVDESNAALHEAYKALHGGKEFTFPPEIKEIGDAARLVRTMIDRCLRVFDSGRPDLAAQDIVEVLLLVTTPMMSPGE